MKWPVLNNLKNIFQKIIYFIILILHDLYFLWNERHPCYVIFELIYKSSFEKDMDRSTNADNSTKLVTIQSRKQGMVFKNISRLKG